jgi:hypothetical protein
MTTELKFSEYRPGYYPSHKQYEAWLLVDGTPVSYLNLMVAEGYEGYACICDIETRDGHERKGYAKELLKMASEALGMPLAVTGSFTPDGFASLNGKFPLLPGYTDYGKPVCKPMKFVYDWDNFYGAN